MFEILTIFTNEASSPDYVSAIIGLLAGLGALLIGFKLLSDNIEKLATTGLKKLFNKTSENPWVGVGIGASVTAIIQSSGASTIMIVGFVNAGLITLFQATAMIMGANIGTTVTAQIAQLGTFGEGVPDIGFYATLLAFVGAFMNMLCKKEKPKTFGLVLAGLGLVFVSLNLMKDSMSVFSEENGPVQILLSQIENPFLLLLIGIVLTALLQSSSALTSILLVMVSQGLQIGTDSNAILYIILGTNIGSCATALLSSFGASTNGKRASLIHLLFNTFGSMIFFVVLTLWPTFMDDTFGSWFSSGSTQIAMFHTFFNVLFTLLFLPFIKLFVKVANLLIPDKKEVLYESFIDDRFLTTPSVAVMQVAKEVVRMGSLAMETLNVGVDGFINHNMETREEVNSKIKIIDAMNTDILAYLVKISALDINPEESQFVSILHHSLNDFYRAIEIADNMCKYTRHLVEDPLVFSKAVFEEIDLFRNKLNNQFFMVEKILLEKEFELLEKVDSLEDEMDKLRSKMIRDHIARLEKGECSPISSGVYINLVSNLERAGDHLHTIAHNVVDNI